MKKLFAAAILGAATMMAATTAVSADKITTFDPNVVMETPNSNWKEVKDPDTTITLTDGEDIVKVNSFGLNDELPKPATKSEKFAEIYQTYYTTENKIYMVTGFAADKDDIDEVRAVVESISLADHVKPEAKAEEKQTEKAEKTEEKKEEKKEGTKALELTGNTAGVYRDGDPNYAVFEIKEYSDYSWKDSEGNNYWQLEYGVWQNDLGQTFYHEDNLASDGSETTGVTMTLYRQGKSVVIEEHPNGSWFGRDDRCWYVSNGDGTWTNYITGKTFWEDENAAADNEESCEPTGSTMTLYRDEDTSEVEVMEYTDGSWKDAKGYDYWQLSDSLWANDLGETFVDADHLVDEGEQDLIAIEPTGNSMVLYSEYDDVRIYEYSDGTWMGRNGDCEYVNNYDGSWTSLETGMTFYE